MNKDTYAECDQYIEDLFAQEPSDLKDIIKVIDEYNLPQQSVSATQGQWMQTMAAACGAKNILEIGTFIGYSTVWLTKCLAQGGKVITIESESLHSQLAMQSFRNCNVSHLIDLRTGNAKNILQEMLSENLPPFDMVFIDADKPAYIDYFNLALKLCRKGAIIIADNVIRGGKVLDAGSTDEKVIGVQQFNKMLSECNDAVSTIIQTVGKKEHDGISISVVK
jgi:predicted O-methyltransferase YrrM